MLDSDVRSEIYHAMPINLETRIDCIRKPANKNAQTFKSIIRLVYRTADPPGTM